MHKKFSIIILPLIFLFALNSSSPGFDNNKENFNSTTREPIDYTPEKRMGDPFFCSYLLPPLFF
jgi:hypothetical protein